MEGGVRVCFSFCGVLHGPFGFCKVCIGGFRVSRLVLLGLSGLIRFTGLEPRVSWGSGLTRRINEGARNLFIVPLLQSLKDQDNACSGSKRIRGVLHGIVGRDSAKPRPIQQVRSVATQCFLFAQAREHRGP